MASGCDTLNRRCHVAGYGSRQRNRASIFGHRVYSAE